MIVDAEALLDDALKIDAPPAHHAVDLWSGPVSTILRQFRPSAPATDAERGPLRPIVQQAVGARFVKAVNPVAQRLTVHAADTRGVGAAHTVQNRRQRQQSPPLADRPGTPGQTSKFLPPNNPSAMSPMLAWRESSRARESEKRRTTKSRVSSEGGAFGISLSSLSLRHDRLHFGRARGRAARRRHRPGRCPTPRRQCRRDRGANPRKTRDKAFHFVPMFAR